MFTNEEVKIFTYFDGFGMAFIDPLEIKINMDGLDIDWETVFTGVENNDAEALKQAVEAGRKVFNLKAPYFDPETQSVKGLTSLGVIKILAYFVLYTDSIKKNIDPTPTSLPSTDVQATQ